MAAAKSVISNMSCLKGDEDNDNAHHDGPVKKAFEITAVCDAFEMCIFDKNAISMDQYLNAFHELLRFFHLLGSVFIFVAKDVDSKLIILSSYAKDEELSVHYQTIQSMIEYEKSNNLLKDTKRPSGSRTLLRLHRALEFISQFMLHVSKLDDHCGTAHGARDCYKRTLAKHHPWYIQKSALLAMYALPYRYQLVERAFGSLPIDDGPTVTQSMARLSVIANEVYHATHKLYDEHNLLDLP